MFTRRCFIAGAANMAVMAAFLAVGTLPAHAQDYPTKPITIVMPNNPGGATDRMARLLAPMLAQELGQPINVINKPGGGTLTGHAYMFAQPADGYHFSYTALPYMVSNIVNQNAPFTMADFSWINVQQIASTVVFVHKDRPYKTMGDLVEALKVPGKLSAAVIGGSSEHVGALLLMDALKLPRTNLRLVTYDGGGTARTAISGGQVDFAMLPGEGSEGIADFVRPVAVYADAPVAEFDAPPVNEALKPFNAQVPVIPSSTRVFVARKGFETDQPQAYAKFVAAYRKVVESDAFQKEATAGKLGREWRGPVESQRIIDQNYEQIMKYSGEISGK